MRSTDSRVRLQTDVPLAPLSTLGVGGAARWFAQVDSLPALQEMHGWAAERGVSVFVLGGGSNVVVADRGVAGLVLQMAITGINIRQDATDSLIRAGAGDSWDALVSLSVDHGLAGLECLSGIPGSVGGTPIQNVGAYGQEVADTIEEVTVFDWNALCVTSLTAAECGFSYRMSRFKQADAGRFVVCAVTFRLRAGVPTVTYPDVAAHLQRIGSVDPGLVEVRQAVLAIRRSKGMVLDSTDPDTRSVGSFFMNPVVPAAIHADLVKAAMPGATRVPGFVLPTGDVKVPAAWLIEQAGFTRGYTLGAAGLSSKHPLAIVNRGGATAREVLTLAERIKRAVVERFGIWLRPEPVFVGFSGDETEYLRNAGPGV